MYEVETKRQEKWVRINKEQLAEMSADLKRYQLMFRILFAYLILDVLIHFDLLI